MMACDNNPKRLKNVTILKQVLIFKVNKMEFLQFIFVTSSNVIAQKKTNFG